MSVAVASELLAGELGAYEHALESALEAQGEYLTELERALYRGGKRVRPILLLLSARAGQSARAAREPLPTKTIRAAVSLEMLHVATLIHDDIVDAAGSRRGLPSVNAARGRDVALLVGDLQFVQALRSFAGAVSTASDMTLVRLVLDAGFNLCRGQLDELTGPPTDDPRELRERCLCTIDRKTAVLFGLACESGALLADARERVAWTLGRYGRLLGRAFQMMDDLRDLVEPPLRSGKPRGADLAHGRVSLPVIYASEELAPQSPAHGALRGEGVPAELLERAARDIVATGGFVRAYAQARGSALDAVELLRGLPDSEYQRALEGLALEVVDRGFCDPSARAPALSEQVGAACPI